MELGIHIEGCYLARALSPLLVWSVARVLLISVYVPTTVKQRLILQMHFYEIIMSIKVFGPTAILMKIPLYGAPCPTEDVYAEVS